MSQVMKLVATWKVAVIKIFEGINENIVIIIHIVWEFQQWYRKHNKMNSLSEMVSENKHSGMILKACAWKEATSYIEHKADTMIRIGTMRRGWDVSGPEQNCKWFGVMLAPFIVVVFLCVLPNNLWAVSKSFGMYEQTLSFHQCKDSK